MAAAGEKPMAVDSAWTKPTARGSAYEQNLGPPLGLA